MEKPIEEPVVVERVVAPRTHIAGMLTLALIFFASAGSTVAYLSKASPPGGSQVAASSTTASDAFQNVRLQAESAYVFDITTGNTLYARNADVQLPLASLTKVALALAVSEVLPLDSIIRIPYTTIAPGIGSQNLKARQQWRMQDLLTYTLVASSNDGADILAGAANDDIRAHYPKAPLENATLWRMNDLARSLGLTHTYFLNTSGLDVSTTQAGAYGSARDVAALFAYAATSSASIFTGTTEGDLVFTSLDGEKTSVQNTDTVLGSIPGVVLGKTGFTDLAGGNLAVVFDVGPAHPVVIVVMHSTKEGRFEDMKTLISATLASITSEAN